MLQSLREETEGKLQMLVSLKNGQDSLFKEVRAFKVVPLCSWEVWAYVVASKQTLENLAKTERKTTYANLCSAQP